MRKLHVDVETYSEVDLIAVGAWAYSMHPSTECLMLAHAFNDSEPVIWLPGDLMPIWAAQMINNDVDFRINAWNDFFELCIMKNVLKWPVPPPAYWEDTAAKAAALALPRSLAGCGAALGLKGADAKDKKGKDLINIFSKPKISTKRADKGAIIRTYPADKPELFLDFQKYCKQDVIAERAIDKMLPALQPNTRKLWELDRKINLRGVHFDMPSVHNAIIVADKAKARGLAKVEEMTLGLLDNISSRNQFLEYIFQTYDVELENAQAEYLKTMAKELSETNKPVSDLIKMRLRLSKSSLAKYDKLIKIIDDSSRGYGLLRFHGASTGRWSGNLFQPQNLPRKSLDMPDLCIDLLSYQDPEVIEIFFDDCLEALTKCLRGMITASPGNRLVVSDFAQIESRVLAWLACDEDKLDLYRNSLDIYKVNAAAAYKSRYENITKEQRQIGKVIELACGYQGGPGAFQQFAKVYGVVIPDKEAKVLIDNWRQANPNIVDYWHDIEAAAVKAVGDPGSIHSVNNIHYKVMGNGKASFLFCRLPSGRAIAYHSPRLVEGKFGKYQVQYYGTGSKTNGYGKQHSYGGKFVENITQAVAFDVLAEAMLRLDDAGYPLILSVHDEPASDTPIGHGSIEDFNRIMEIVPIWASGLPISADGYEAKRYRK